MIWIFIWFLFLFLRLPSLFEPYWYGDEGIYLTLGQAIKKGLILYQQIHDNKPPTLYYLAAIGQTVFGFRLLLLLVMIPTIYLFYRLSQKFLSTKLSQLSTFIFVVLSSLPFIEGNMANAENFMFLPTIAGLLLFVNSKKNIQFYLSGFLLGLVFTIKIPVFIEVFFLIFYLLIINFKEIKKYFFRYLSRPFFLGLGFLTPILIYLVYFYLLGVVLPFLKSALLQNFSYISSWSTGNQVSSVSSGGISQRFIILLLLWFIFTFFYFKKIINHHLFLVFGWFFACIFGSLLSTRPYPHYLLQTLPPFCLLVGYLFSKKIHLNKIFILISFLFLFLIIKKYNFYFYSNFSYYNNFYLNHNNKKYFGSNVEATYQISDYIKQNTQKNDQIFIWGDEPYIYALTNRLPVGKYTVAYHIVDFNGYQETIDSIQANFPKFIIYFSMNNRSFPNLDDILNRYYFLDKKIQSVLIFQKR